MRLAVFALLLLAGQALAAGRTDLRARLDALVDPLVRDRWVAGVSIAVIRPEGTTFAGYGSTAGASPHVPGPRTVFGLASVSKTFSAALLAEAAADGLVKLDDPVARHLPAGPTVPETLTLAHLATQHSGLASDPSTDFDPYAADPYRGWTTERMRVDIARTSLLAAPGETYTYSNMGISLMTAAVEHRRGASFAELLEKRLAAPLGLTATRVGLPESGDVATPCDDELKPVAFWSPSAAAPAGGVASNAEDLARWIRAQIDPPSGRLGDALRATHVPRKAVAEGLAVGLAWHVNTGPGVVWHNGRLQGVTSYIGFSKESGVGVVLLVNTGTFLTDGLARRVLAVAQGEPAEPLTLPVESAPVPLTGLAGRYQHPHGTMSFTEESASLRVGWPGTPTWRIWPSGPDQFFLRAGRVAYRFERDATGRVSGVHVTAGGQTTFAPRAQ